MGKEFILSFSFCRSAFNSSVVIFLLFINIPFIVKNIAINVVYNKCFLKTIILTIKKRIGKGGIDKMTNRIVVKKKKGEDDNLVTSVRLPRDLVDRLDKFAAKTDLSRTQLIVSLLSQALDIAEIEE
jgi:hypothetical protein